VNRRGRHVAAFHQERMLLPVHAFELERPIVPVPGEHFRVVHEAGTARKQQRCAQGVPPNRRGDRRHCMALREGSRDETPFEGLVFPFYHFALETYRQSGPKTAYLGLGESKNDRFRCK
jgi:hypothetical protein